MSLQTERVFKEFQKFLDQHGAKEEYSDNDLDVLAKLFFEQYNKETSEPVTPETAETADDWLELAEMAETDEEVLKYARRALKADPNNLDAERMVIQYGDQGIMEQLKALREAVARGTELMKRQGYMEEGSIGDFWGVLETRPYMRLRRAYVDALTDLGMMGRAMEECVEMLRLCKADNLGIRYTLMHLCALMEREEEALALHQQFDGHDEGQMLLPLSVLYFKKEDLDKALWYLRKLEKANPDTRKFIQAMNNGTVHKHYTELAQSGYRPGTMDELVMGLYDNAFLYGEMKAFFEWAHKTLRKKK